MKTLLYDDSLLFSDYIRQCRDFIEAHRPDLKQASPSLHQHIIEANTPFELQPTAGSSQRHQYGVLLIHGLLDSPFSMREIATHLQQQGILTRAILLPGHGVTPENLLDVTYQNWQQAVRYGIKSLQQEVEHVFLLGFSTGAALALHHVLEANDIAGVIQLCPVYRIKIPVDAFITWRQLAVWLRKNKKWLEHVPENNYAKYESIPFHAISEVCQLTMAIKTLSKTRFPSCPLLMILSEQDETVSGTAARRYFSQLKEPHHQLLLYTTNTQNDADTRIIKRSSSYPALHINHFSHNSIPFSSANAHYGIQGDCPYATQPSLADTYYGAYNKLEIQCYDALYRWQCSKYKRRELTFNPDFQFMVNKISEFIATVNKL